MGSDVNSPFVIDIDETNFASEVVAKSRQVPVLIDFWADWCAPCRLLTPILERLAAEFNGAFILAKLNTESSPQLAAQFGIRSIPNVKLVREGRLVDEFVGALPEESIREFLRRHIETEIDRQMAEAARLAQAGEAGRARELYEAVLQAEPTNYAAHLQLARLLLTEGDDAGAEEQFNAIPPSALEFDAIAQLRQVSEFRQECRAAGGAAASRDRLQADPADLNARYALACCLTEAGEYEAALAEFLQIVIKDKSFREEAARRAMLTIFALVGERSELANDYRRRLASALY